MKTLGSIESFTGGLFAAKIVAQEGASKFFKGAVVCYANEIKEKIGVDTSSGVINSKVAQQLALQGKKFLNVDICVAFTGNAGPSVLDKKPVGEIYIAINEKVFPLKLEGNRESIINQAIAFALLKVKKLLKE